VEKRESQVRMHGRHELTASSILALDGDPGRLLCLLEGEHVLLITMHHIVSDACRSSVGPRTSVFYGAYREGQSAALPSLPIQYADYAHWQQQLLKGENCRGS